MRFQPKHKRMRVPMRRDIKFEDYRWDAPKITGWHPLVCLNAKAKDTAAGGDMWVIDFGIDLPEGVKSRIRWHVPMSFIPKVDMLQEVLMAEMEDSEGDFEFEPKTLMFRTCVGLIEIDHEFQREDGEDSWQLVKIIKDADAEEELGHDWVNNRAADSDGEGGSDDGEGGSDDDENVFGDD